MKPSTDIPSELLDNSGSFKNEFFDRFELRYADAPLRLNEDIEKNYQFPTFYGDVTCAMAVFFCSYERAKAILPHPGMKPVSMGRGRALVVFSCYEYKNVLGVAPYNEIAMTIPVMLNPSINVPVLPMLMPVFKGFGYYCFSMPVTSLENKIRGQKIWGLPKAVEEISITHKDNFCEIQAIDSDQQSYFELSVPTDGRDTVFDVNSNLYSLKNNELQQSQTSFQGSFKVIKHLNALITKPQKPDREYLKIGDGPSAGILNKLQIEKFPFQLRYCASMNSCFDLPNPEFNPKF